jgi:hexosaminidase
MRKILTFLFLCGALLPLNAQNKLPFDPANLRLEWQLVQNQYQGKSLSLTRLSLSNDGKKALPRSGWTLYFNFVRPVVAEFSRPFGLEAEHLGGDWFRFKLLPKFPGIPAGGKYEVDLVADLWLMNKTDAPNGFYVVFDDDPEKGYALTPPKLVSPTHPELLATGSEDKTPAMTPELAYRQNEATINIPTDSLKPIFPTPASFEYKKGAFLLKSDLVINTDPALKPEADWLAKTLTPLLDKSNIKVGMGKRPGIRLKLAAMPNTAEWYHLEISEEFGIVISASSHSGIFYGMQSLLTLLPPELWQKPASSIKIPGMWVIDGPRFPYRGLHVDVARNFQPASEILKLLDAMALYKMNKLHFHFSDDEGWRIEIPGLPELTEIGSKRGHSTAEDNFLHPALGSGPAVDASWGSGHYSRSEFIQILAYAKERHIEVIPEIELPGHARAAVKAMTIRRQRLLKEGQPEAAEKYNLYDPQDRSVYLSVQSYNDNVVCVGLNSTYTFIEKVLDELLAMYKEAGAPLSTVHLGGDEVPAGVWEKSPACQKLMKSEGLSNSSELWYYFWGKMREMVQKRGLALSGWEEVGLRKTRLDGNPHNIPNPDFADDGFQMYVWNNVLGWGAEDLAYQLANSGYKVVLGPVSNMYFDMAYQKDFEEPGYYWGAYTDVDKTFGFVPFDYFKTAQTDRFGNPVDPAIFIGKSRLTDYGKSNIIGLEGLIWSETLQGPATLEYMVFPKLLGLAERAWAPAPTWETMPVGPLFEQKYAADWSHFSNQLGKRELPRLDFYSGGFQYRIPTPGAVIRDGLLYANLQLPGFVIRYTMDGTEPNVKSPIYNAPVPVSSVVKIRAFDRNGRGSRTVWVD